MLETTIEKTGKWVEYGYSGSDWLESNLKYVHPDTVISPLGRDVADLLGELFYGIYHLDNKALYKVDWSNNHHIIISICFQDWSTINCSNLTRLVFLAHHMALRVNMKASTHNYMQLMFHKRGRSGNFTQRHPTLDEAVSTFKANVTIPEYCDEETPAKEEAC